MLTMAHATLYNRLSLVQSLGVEVFLSRLNSCGIEQFSIDVVICRGRGEYHDWIWLDYICT